MEKQTQPPFQSTVMSTQNNQHNAVDPSSQTLTLPQTQPQIQPADPENHDPSPATITTTTTTTAAAAAAKLADAKSSEYPHQVHGAGGPTATAPFLQDFSLVAEAAKRAQMAVVMRDMEGISL